uniref:C-type lectin domain-containing protein n=1 Tax=Cyprinus carpio TaxID=7962 RepID=A0A8C2D1M4_CYPCA
YTLQKISNLLCILSYFPFVPILYEQTYTLLYLILYGTSNFQVCSSVLNRNLLLTGKNSFQYKFKYVKNNKNWHDAQKYCRSNYVDLATVTDDTENMHLEADAVNFQSFAWIGFYNGVLTWRWSYKNTVISYTKWQSSEPDTYRTQEACVFIDKNQWWSDINSFSVLTANLTPYRQEPN